MNRVADLVSNATSLTPILTMTTKESTLKDVIRRKRAFLGTVKSSDTQNKTKQNDHPYSVPLVSYRRKRIPPVQVLDNDFSHLKKKKTVMPVYFSFRVPRDPSLSTSTPITSFPSGVSE